MNELDAQMALIYGANDKNWKVMAKAVEMDAVASLKKAEGEYEEALSELRKHDGEDGYLARYGTRCPELNERIRDLESLLLSLKALNAEIGGAISLSPFTDWDSYEIIKRTRYTLTLRRNRQTKYKTCWQDGELEAVPDPNGAVIRIVWSKKCHWWSYGCWRVALGKRDYEDPSF